MGQQLYSDGRTRDIIRTKQVFDHLLLYSPRCFVADNSNVGSALSVAKFFSKLAQLEGRVGLVGSLDTSVAGICGHGNIDDILSPVGTGLVEYGFVERLRVAEVVVDTTIVILVNRWQSSQHSSLQTSD